MAPSHFQALPRSNTKLIKKEKSEKEESEKQNLRESTGRLKRKERGRKEI